MNDLKEQGFDSDFTLRASMRQMSQEDLDRFGHSELDPGYHPYLTGMSKSEKFFIVKKMSTRSKHRGRGTRPDNLRLHIVSHEDVTVKQRRRWNESDNVEVQEVSKEELWERLLGEPQGFFKSSERGE